MRRRTDDYRDMHVSINRIAISNLTRDALASPNRYIDILAESI